MDRPKGLAGLAGGVPTVVEPDGADGEAIAQAGADGEPCLAQPGTHAATRRTGIGKEREIEVVPDRRDKFHVGHCEGLAAREYWNYHTPDADFKRTREGAMPNAALNYGYAILRAATARALTGSGLSCLSGLHHHNQYNALTLADDVMEPYRPLVNDTVLNHTEFFPAEALELTRDMKAALLNL